MATGQPLEPGNSVSARNLRPAAHWNENKYNTRTFIFSVRSTANGKAGILLPKPPK